MTLSRRDLVVAAGSVGVLLPFTAVPAVAAGRSAGPEADRKAIKAMAGDYKINT